MAVARGDANIWDGPLVISVTVVGEATARGGCQTQRAKPGDWILVTGTLGGSLSGKHALFEPRVEEALLLHAAADLHAMIDISDGLAADLHHILDESGVGAVVHAEAIPILRNAQTPWQATDRRWSERLGDGEAWTLEFTVAPRRPRKNC
jgi:thiamine-monophosphate kinase